MVTPTCWMYVVDWGPRIWQMLCKSFAYDIERYFWRVVDSIWSFVVSETKTKWNVYCVVRQDTYTGSGKFTLAPSSLPRIPAFFIAFPTAAKRSLKKEMIGCSKQPQTFSLHPSMVLSTCVSHLLYYLPAARFQNTRIFFIKFYFIWTYQERFEHNSEISRKKLAVIFAMLTCLLW